MRQRSGQRLVPTVVRLPEPLYEELQRQARERVVSASLIVTKAVQAYLAGLPRVEQ